MYIYMYTRGAKVVYFINCQLGDCYQSPVHQNQNPFLTVLLIPFFFSISHFKSCCNVRPPCVGLLAVREGTALKVPAIQVPCHIVKVILCENLRRFFLFRDLDDFWQVKRFFFWEKNPGSGWTFLMHAYQNAARNFYVAVLLWGWRLVAEDPSEPSFTLLGRGHTQSYTI